MPCRTRPADASVEHRQSAALRLRRLSERQRAAAGDPVGLCAPPSAILALFQ